MKGKEELKRKFQTQMIFSRPETAPWLREVDMTVGFQKVKHKLLKSTPNIVIGHLEREGLGFCSTISFELTDIFFIVTAVSGVYGVTYTLQFYLLIEEYSMSIVPI